MKFNKKTAELYIPDQKPFGEAIKRTTHMSIAAHQDDLEIMAYDGILKCFGNDDKWFFGVVVTNGSGSARNGIYKDYTDEEMIQIRRVEQKKAADIGEFGAVALLDYSSKETKDKNNNEIIFEFKDLIEKAQPQVLYTHNLADKHDTHIGVTTKVIKAIRMMDKNLRPKSLYGCEVWRDLDWMNDQEKIIFDVGGRPNLASALVGVFDSQISGGKRYDLGTEGRRMANATYSSSHTVDETDAIILGMDLTPLIKDDDLNIESYVLGYIDRFKEDVSKRIKKII